MKALNGQYSLRSTIGRGSPYPQISRRQLTLKNHMARFCLLNLESTCGNQPGKTSLPPISAGQETVPSTTATNHLHRFFSELLEPRPLSFALLYARQGKLIRSFQNLRAMSMTNNTRIRAAIPHQSIRILSCAIRFQSPRRHFDSYQGRPEKKPIRRNGHGFARAIEDLRRVRKPLVPCPIRGERLLQGLCNKTERLSIPAESEKKGAS